MFHCNSCVRSNDPGQEEIVEGKCPYFEEAEKEVY
jgi:hypothetical protein